MYEQNILHLGIHGPLMFAHNPNKPKHQIRIPLEISENLAYLCGVFAGDGSLNYRESKKEYMLKCVGNPKDEKEFYHEVIGPLLQNVFNYCPKMRHYDSNTTFGFVIYSKALFTFLTQQIGLPFGKKYDALKIPTVFRNNQKLVVAFIRGVFDTDGCICFKRKYRKIPYYPVISISSKSKVFILEISDILRRFGFKLYLALDYKVKDPRFQIGYTIINRIELNGEENLALWQNSIGFFSPKHLAKIKPMILIMGQ